MSTLHHINTALRCQRSIISTLHYIVNLTSYLRCITLSTLHYIINVSLHDQWWIISLTLRHIINAALHCQRSITSKLDYIVNAALHCQLSIMSMLHYIVNAGLHHHHCNKSSTLHCQRCFTRATLHYIVSTSSSRLHWNKVQMPRRTPSRNAKFHTWILSRQKLHNLGTLSL